MKKIKSKSYISRYANGSDWHQDLDQANINSLQEKEKETLEYWNKMKKDILHDIPSWVHESHNLNDSEYRKKAKASFRAMVDEAKENFPSIKKALSLSSNKKEFWNNLAELNPKMSFMFNNSVGDNTTSIGSWPMSQILKIYFPSQTTFSKNDAKNRCLHYLGEIDESLHILEFAVNNFSKFDKHELLQDTSTALGRIIDAINKCIKYTPFTQDKKFIDDLFETIAIPFGLRFTTIEKELKTRNPELHEACIPSINKIAELLDDMLI